MLIIRVGSSTKVCKVWFLRFAVIGASRSVGHTMSERELIQIVGSDHRRCEDRGDPCTLLVFIDGVTSTLMELMFVKSESTFSYFDPLEATF